MSQGTREPASAPIGHQEAMTPAEIEAQRQSWVRGMTTPCEHGELDFEQRPKCLAKRATDR